MMIKVRKNSILAFFLGAAVTAGGTGLLLYQAEPRGAGQAAAPFDPFPKFTMQSAAPDQVGFNEMQPAVPDQTGLADVPTMIARLAKRLEQNPDNPDGWRMLGWSYLATGQARQAADAYAKAIQLKGDTADYRSGYGEALVRAANGTVTPAAKTAFDSALAIDAGDARARFFVGLAKRQGGDLRGAYEVWAALQKEAPSDAPFAEELRTHLASVSRDLGIASPMGALPDKPSQPFAAAGPNTTGIQPKQEERIRGMVEGLAQRLADTPDDADGWRMLGKSYDVLGNHARSVQAYGRLLALRPDDQSAHRLYAEAVLKTVNDSEPYPASLSEPLEWLYRSNPKDEFALFHLGELNSRTGQKEKAMQYWRSLLDVLPKNSAMWTTVASKLQTRLPNPN